MFNVGSAASAAAVGTNEHARALTLREAEEVVLEPRRSASSHESPPIATIVPSMAERYRREHARPVPLGAVRGRGAAAARRARAVGALHRHAERLARAAAQGSSSVAGITTGTLVHIAAATVGLSALLASSALAFDVVKYLGAAYLIVVGIRRLAGSAQREPERGRAPRTSAASTARASS